MPSDNQLTPIKPTGILGQVSSLAVILVFLVLAVVITGLSISRLQLGTTQRILEVKNMDAAYTFAMSGIQEAIATRMSPRSNFIALENKQTPSGTIAQQFRPYQAESGYVYKDPINKTELVGFYRYFILGGDPARKPTSGDWWLGNSIPSGTPPYNAIGGDAIHFLDIIPEQPIIIVSRGSACIDPKTRLIGSNQLQYPLSGFTPRVPRCNSTNFKLYEQTILAVYDMSRTTSTHTDKIVDYRLFSTSEYAPGFANDVTIPNNIRVSITGSLSYSPNTPLNAFNFQRVWNASSNNPQFAAWVPAAVSFYNLSATSPYWFETLSFSGSPATANLDSGHPPVDAKSAIKLQFRGAVDFLSMFADQKTRDYPAGQYRSIKGCQDNPDTCNVVICKLPEHTLMSGTATFPNNPANTAFITLPPPPGAPGGSGYTTSSQYEIILRWVSTAWGSQMAYTTNNKAVSDQDLTLTNGPCNPLHSGYNSAYHILFRTQ
ncbi:MAG: hypothetical protein K2X01_10230 [Cyanobacteria bacterium]|nr:hypothetical protein [Cyanobacteriota bacterium]